MTRVLRTITTPVLVALLAAVVLAGPVGSAWAQQRPPAPQPQPQRSQGRQLPEVPMESVFFNVVWGSAVGATLGIAASVVASPTPTQPVDLRQSVFSGATGGGMIGLGVGLFLVYNGISFDETMTSFFGTLADAAPPARFSEPSAYAVAQRSTLPPVHYAPLTLETSRHGSFRITGFKARVLNLKF